MLACGLDLNFLHLRGHAYILMVLNLNWLPLRPWDPIPVGWLKLKGSICFKLAVPIDGPVVLLYFQIYF